MSNFGHNSKWPPFWKHSKYTLRFTFCWYTSNYSLRRLDPANSILPSTVKSNKRKEAVVKISASEHTSKFKRLLRLNNYLKDSWSLVAQSTAVMSMQGSTSFSEVSSHKTRDITLKYKIQSSRNLSPWFRLLGT